MQPLAGLSPQAQDRDVGAGRDLEAWNHGARAQTVARDLDALCQLGEQSQALWEEEDWVRIPGVERFLQHD
jgi:hypothetical protein